MEKENRNAKRKKSLKMFCNDTTFNDSRKCITQLQYSAHVFSIWYFSVSNFKCCCAITGSSNHHIYPTTGWITKIPTCADLLPTLDRLGERFQAWFLTETHLIGLSYMTEICSSTQFDVKDAKVHFEKIMQNKVFELSKISISPSLMIHHQVYLHWRIVMTCFEKISQILEQWCALANLKNLVWIPYLDQTNCINNLQWTLLSEQIVAIFEINTIIQSSNFFIHLIYIPLCECMHT